MSLQDERLEQEVISIIRYVLNKSGLEKFYTDELPKSFAIPSVYFPAPELDSEYDTLSTYSVHYRMPVRFFAAKTQAAYKYARTVANSLIAERNRVPLIDENGNNGGEHFKIKRSDVKKIDSGVYGFNVEWDSVRTFDDIPDEEDSGENEIHVSFRFTT